MSRDWSQSCTTGPSRLINHDRDTFDDRQRIQQLDRAALSAAAVEEAQRTARRTTRAQRLLPAQARRLPRTARKPRSTRLAAAHQQTRTSTATRRRAFRRQSHVPDRTLRPLPPNLRHPRPAARRRRHGRRLAVVDRSLAIRARRGARHSRRSRPARVFVRPVHRLLERIRRARRARRTGDSRRRPQQPGSHSN